VEKISTTVLAVCKRDKKGTYVKVLCLLIVNVNVTKYMSRNVQYGRFVAIRCVFQTLNTPKLVFGRHGLAPDSAGELTLRLPSRLGKGTPPPHTLSPRRLLPLDLGTAPSPRFSGPQHKFLATPM